MFENVVLAKFDNTEIVTSYKFQNGMSIPRKGAYITFDKIYYKVLDVNYNYDLKTIMIILIVDKDMEIYKFK